MVPKILLVDDDPLLLSILAKSLVKSGFSVDEAENGAIAIEKFETPGSNYDLVITDLQMPVLNGAQFLKHIRKVSQIPVIVLTGYTADYPPEKMIPEGATAYLSKPVLREDLLKHINNCLRQSKKDTVVDTTSRQSS